MNHHDYIMHYAGHDDPDDDPDDDEDDTDDDSSEAEQVAFDRDREELWQLVGYDELGEEPIWLGRPAPAWDDPRE